MIWSFIWLVFTFCSCSFVSSSDDYSGQSLDAALQAYAFKALARHRPHTGAQYRAVLPANFSTISVSVVRLRSRRLWNRGLNLASFQIPPRTLPVPHVRRVAIVFQNLGNLSSQFYGVKGHSLITPVVGFLVFDASNVSAKVFRKLSLHTTGKPISIHFPRLALPEGMISETRCATFSSNGTWHLSDMSLPGICYSREQGHFAIVVKQKTKKGLWYLWVVGIVLGVPVVVLLGYAGMVTVRILKTKKIQVLERHADEDLILESRWVGSGKMPSAAVTRTQPVLENGGDVQ